MDQPSNPASSRFSPPEWSVSPLAVLSAVAVTGGLTAYLLRPDRRTRPAERRRQLLVAYLRDHLGGSDVAIQVVHRLASTHTRTEEGPLFHRLSNEFAEDRSVVYSLLRQLGSSGRSLKRAAGYAGGWLLSVPAGGEPGDLSLLRTLEALAIGVQGKRCLWRALQEVSTVPLITGGTNFVDLEAKAVRQWEAIEQRRRALVAATFSATHSGRLSR